MVICREPNALFSSIAGKQEIINTKYRLIKYIEICKDSTHLIYNLLNGAFLSISDSEYELVSNLDKIDVDNPFCQYLIENWFVVPIKFDEHKFWLQVKTTLRLFKNTTNIEDYIIFTTTDCNARCFYCYENGINKFPMSNEVAHKTAKYIVEHCGSAVPILRWFGGEPLYNEKAIDIICDDLDKSGIEFKSSIVSNGYLFNDENVIKAKNKWKTLYVQISLDGTEDVYNRAKNFIYDSEESPYVRVLDNIDRLLNAGVGVLIRLNMGIHNYEDMCDLVQILCQRFGNRDDNLCSVYFAMLFDFAHTRPKEERTLLVNHIIEQEEILFENNLVRIKLPKVMSINHCIADSGKGCTITPNGKIGLCEHHVEDELWSDLDATFRDESVLSRWRELADSIPECDNCSLRPNCLKLKHCPENDSVCDDDNRRLLHYRLQRSMKLFYKNFSKKEAVDPVEKLYMHD